MTLSHSTTTCFIISQLQTQLIPGIIYSKKSHPMGVSMLAFALRLRLSYCAKQNSAESIPTVTDRKPIMGCQAGLPGMHTSFWGDPWEYPPDTSVCPSAKGFPGQGHKAKPFLHCGPNLLCGLSHSVVFNFPFEVL